jgi:hypothetical protein
MLEKMTWKCREPPMRIELMRVGGSMGSLSRDGARKTKPCNAYSLPNFFDDSPPARRAPVMAGIE